MDNARRKYSRVVVKEKGVFSVLDITWMLLELGAQEGEGYLFRAGHSMEDTRARRSRRRRVSFLCWAFNGGYSGRGGWLRRRKGVAEEKMVVKEQRSAKEKGLWRRRGCGGEGAVEEEMAVMEKSAGKKKGAGKKKVTRKGEKGCEGEVGLCYAGS
jgi:hypothetical protein